MITSGIRLVVYGSVSQWGPFTLMVFITSTIINNRFEGDRLDVGGQVGRCELPSHLEGGAVQQHLKNLI